MASKAQQRKFINTADEHQQAVVHTIRSLSNMHGLERTWSDWVEMCALSIANAVDRSQFEQREKRYMEIVRRYDQASLQQLAKAFAQLVECWDDRVTSGRFGDVLGSTFMMLDMGNAGTGQFFTPYEVSRLMASMIMGDHKALAGQVETRGFLRLMEPACGAGGMIIASAHAAHDAKINYQQAMHVTAIDIDQRCVHMTYVQLALLNIPAVVIHGNALTGEEWGHWYTPAHVLGGWATRLRQRDTVDAMLDVLTAPETVDTMAPAATADSVPVAVPAARQPALSSAARRAASAGQMTLF